MDTAAQYRVVFNGDVRKGFEQDKVRQTLARQLGLNEAQAEQLFRGDKKHTLKRTASEEEARHYIMLLARFGAVASIEPHSGEEPDEPDVDQPQKKSHAPRTEAKQPAVRRHHRPLPKYSPLPRNGLFRARLYLAATVETLFTLVYALLLLAVLAGTFYYSLFTLWASAVIDHPILALAVQFLCFPLGIIVLVLLAKPLLSLRRPHNRGISIPAGQEPDLHMFIEDLCQRMALPLPREIRLNNDVAINMHHYRGPLGFWRGETVLTLGVPLLAAMNASQLAALIVQAILSARGPQSPRLSFLVVAGNRWLHRAVYGEDALDLALKRWLAQGRLSPALVAPLQAAFAASRKLMTLRLIISRMLERRLVHRLIAEADKRAFALAGSEGFSHMLEQQRLLQFSAGEVVPGLEQQWREEGKLPDDLVQAILQQARSYPATIHEQLRLRQEAEKASSGDIIPSDAQRIKSLSKQHLVPGYDCLSPANTLLRYFAKLAHAMTVRYYHKRLNIPVTPDKLIHPQVKGSAEYELGRVVNDFFNDMPLLQLPLKLGLLLQGKADAADARHQLDEAIRQCDNGRTRAGHEYRHCLEAEERLLDSSLRETMIRADLWRELGEEKPRKGELEAFHKLCRDNEDEYEEALVKMRPYLKPYANRLTAAIALLKFESPVDEAEKLFREANFLIGVYDRIETVLPQLRSLRLHTALLQLLLSYRSGRKQPRLHDRIQEQAADIRQQLTGIRVALKDVANPYPAPRGGKKLMNYLLLESYTEETPTGDFDRGNDVVERLSLMQTRILARLIGIAQQAERL